MQLAAPARTSEASQRGGDHAGFGPALEQAYQAESPRRVPAAREDASDESLSADADDAKITEDAAQTPGGEQDSSAEASAPTEGDAVNAEKPEEGDEAEISEEAAETADAAAAAAVAAVVAPEPIEEAVAAEAADVIASDADVAADPAVTPGGGPDSAESDATRMPAQLHTAESDGTTQAESTKKVMAGRQAKPVADGKQTKAEAREIKAAAKSEDAAEEISETEEGLATAVETQADAEQLTTTAEGAPTEGDAKRREPGDRSERVTLPANDAKVELTAAIERQVAALETATPTPDVAAKETASAPAEPVAAAPAPSRATAALDRISTGSLRRSDAAANGDNGPPIDRHRFVQRVEGAMKAAQQRDGRVQVRLAPPELGSLRIELAVQNGVMSAKLEAESSAARNALLDNLPALRERLAEQSIRIEKFDVDIRQESRGSGGNPTAQDRPGEQGEPGSHERRRTAPVPMKATSGAGARTAAPTAGSSRGLDVRV
jgi:flagellar hook-length control protein FliK